MKENYKDYIRRQHLYLRDKMSLNEYQGGLRFEESPHIEGKDSLNQREVNATCDVSSTYLEYTVTLYPICEKKYNEGRHEEVFQMFLHELCHVYTEPMYVFGYEHCHPVANAELLKMREQTTQRIAYAINSLIRVERSAPTYTDEEVKGMVVGKITRQPKKK